MKKICVVTAARSEYGYLKYIMDLIRKSKDMELLLIATGGHLLAEQGMTIDLIKKDGFVPVKILDAKVNNSSSFEVTQTMARMACLFSEAFYELNPDCLIVLGDRYELLPICNAAYIQEIPIAHICGGDITEGALDDGVRNAVTMLATYHFPSNPESAKNIARMRNSEKNIFMHGSSSLDIFKHCVLLSREKLAQNLILNPSDKWILMTLHSETKLSLEGNLLMVDNLVSVLLEQDSFIVMTKANADLGGKEINEYLSKIAEVNPNRCRLYSSLGQLNYISMLGQVEFVIGNSSSGVLETPFWETPTINIGNRQKGRYQCKNVLQCGITKEEIEKAVNQIAAIKSPFDDKFYWGDGHTSEKIVEELRRVL